MPTSDISAAGRFRSHGSFVVLPALTLNYLGQGALVLAEPEGIENPFFLMYPEWALLPMVVLATAATVIASQAVITGAYSLTRRRSSSDCCRASKSATPRQTQVGQIYMPRVNVLLLARRAAAGRPVPLVQRARLGLRHRGHRHDGRHRADGLHRHLEGLAMAAVRRRSR